MNFESSANEPHIEGEDGKNKNGFIKKIGSVTLGVALACSGLTSCEGEKNRGNGEVDNGDGLESFENSGVFPEEIDFTKGGNVVEGQKRNEESVRCNKWLNDFFVSPGLRSIVSKKYRTPAHHSEIYTKQGSLIGEVFSDGINKDFSFSEVGFVLAVSNLLDKKGIKYVRNYPLFDIGEKVKENGDVNVDPMAILVAEGLKDKGLQYGYFKKNEADVLVFRNDQEDTIVKDEDDFFRLEIDMSDDGNPTSHTDIYTNDDGRIHIKGADTS